MSKQVKIKKKEKKDIKEMERQNKLEEIRKKEVLTLRELAIFLNISENTLYKKLKIYNIPRKKLGNKYLFSKEAVLNWLCKG